VPAKRIPISEHSGYLNDVFFLQEDVIRHCAYCLEICGFPTKLCGNCRKRAYCSKECQIADWSVKGDGQRHINWCRRHEYGEEDVDWEVVPIPNKGLGIRAKKLLPAGLKIIVEPTFSSPNAHQGYFKYILKLFQYRSIQLSIMVFIEQESKISAQKVLI